MRVPRGQVRRELQNLSGRSHEKHMLRRSEKRPPETYHGPNPALPSFRTLSPGAGPNIWSNLATKLLGKPGRHGHLVQRMDCNRFYLAEDIDPGYAEALRIARKAGVEAICYDTSLTTEAISVRCHLPIIP